MPKTHVKHGVDHKGRYAIIYGGPKKIRWVRGDEADRIAKNVRAPSAPQNAAASSSETSTASQVAEMLDLAAGFAGPVASCVGAVANVLQWWEARQDRLAREARYACDTRNELLADMMSQWVGIHADGDGVDLEMTHYLAREAQGLLELVVASKSDLIVPMSLLYDLEQIRAVLRGVRELIAAQVYELVEHGCTELPSPVAIGEDLKLNIDWLSVLAEAPEKRWEEAIAKNEVKQLTEDLRALALRPETVVERLFSSEEKDAGAASVSSLLPMFGRAAAGAAGGALGGALLARIGVVVLGRTLGFAGGPIGLIAATTLPMAIEYWQKTQKSEQARRGDAVRELGLFCAEVEQTRLLHRCWLILDETVRRTTGTGILVLSDGRDLSLLVQDRERAWFQELSPKVLEQHVKRNQLYGRPDQLRLPEKTA